jgi:hypothetical protein
VKFILRSLAVIFGLFVLLLVIGALLPDQPNRTAAAANIKVVPQLNPHDSALESTRIAKFHGRTDESGMILYGTFTIRNDGDAAVKDLKIKCEHRAPSGTVIDSNTRTIYEIVPAHKSRTFSNFNMGFINPQATRSGCQIEDLALVVAPQ